MVMNQQLIFCIFGSIHPGDNALDCGSVFILWQGREGNRRPFSFLF
uniref:Uncharacterized protein n=1 Tax=Anguilla anguilla TaxID=7936 RepID=A0A0E9XIW7_ANGAN